MVARNSLLILGVLFILTAAFLFVQASHKNIQPFVSIPSLHIFRNPEIQYPGICLFFKNLLDGFLGKIMEQPSIAVFFLLAVMKRHI